MGFFKKPEVVILKADSSADEMLVQMKQMCSEARGELKKSWKIKFLFLNVV